MKNVKNIVKKYNLQKLSTKLRFGKSKVEQVLYVPEKTYRRRFKSTDEAQAMDYDEVKDFVDSLNLDDSEYPFDINIVFNYGIRQILRKTENFDGLPDELAGYEHDTSQVYGIFINYYK